MSKGFAEEAGGDARVEQECVSQKQKTSVGLGIAKAGNKQAGITSRYRDTGNEC